MPKTYEPAPDEVKDRAAALVQKFHADVLAAGVTIDYVFARNDEGKAALTQQGYPALAMCRVVNLKDRSKGLADVEITIDAEHYEQMDDPQRDALLDHELHHIGCVKAKDGFETDDLNRPRIKLRKHDWQFGWFSTIAQRHGKASPEVYQAKLIMDNDGQYFWPQLCDKVVEAKIELLPSPKPPAKKRTA